MIAFYTPSFWDLLLSHISQNFLMLNQLLLSLYRLWKTSITCTYEYISICSLVWNAATQHLCARSARNSSSEPCQGPAIPLAWPECPHKAPKGNLSNVCQLEECNQQTRGAEQHRRLLMHWHRRELFGIKAGKQQNRLASAKLHKLTGSYSIC